MCSIFNPLSFYSFPLSPSFLLSLPLSCHSPSLSMFHLSFYPYSHLFSYRPPSPHFIEAIKWFFSPGHSPAMSLGTGLNMFTFRALDRAEGGLRVTDGLKSGQRKWGKGEYIWDLSGKCGRAFEMENSFGKSLEVKLFQFVDTASDEMIILVLGVWWYAQRPIKCLQLAPSVLC